MKFMIIILGIIIPHICCNEAVFNALDKALRNDSSNLYELHRLLYPGSFQVSTVQLFVFSFTVGNITDPSHNHGTAGFIKCGSKYCFNEKNLAFTLSVNEESNSHSRLLNYISEEKLYLEIFDYISYKLFSFLTHSQLYESILYESGSINLAIDELQEMPEYSDVIADLESILGWVKYYAKTYGESNMEKKDTDSMIVSKNYDFAPEAKNSGFKLILLCSMNLIITIVSVYSIPKLLTWCVSYSKGNTNRLTMKDLSELYWAIVIVCAIINIVCTILTCIETHTNAPLIIIRLVTTTFTFIIELISIWFAVKDFEVTFSTCCSNRYVVRVLHTLAVCQILWFLHRVGCSLLVAIYFIALAPAQTMAAISLMYFVIFWTVMYVTVNLHYIKEVKCCQKSSCCLICKLFIFSILYFLVVIFLVMLTLLFNELGNNGLTSSGLGSVIISLVAPTIVFIITLKLRKQLEEYFTKNSNEDEGDNENEANPANVNTPLLS